MGCNQTMNVTPNVLLFGKKRRIFCEDCSEFELGNCIQCNARTEADGIDGTLKCQKCLDAELKKDQDAILEFKRQQNKIKRERYMEKRRSPRRRCIRRKTILYNDVDVKYIDHKYSDVDCVNERLSKMQRNITKYLQRKELKKRISAILKM